MTLVSDWDAGVGGRSDWLRSSPSIMSSQLYCGFGSGFVITSATWCRHDFGNAGTDGTSRDFDVEDRRLVRGSAGGV